METTRCSFSFTSDGGPKFSPGPFPLLVLLALLNNLESIIARCSWLSNDNALKQQKVDTWDDPEDIRVRAIFERVP